MSAATASASSTGDPPFMGYVQFTPSAGSWRCIGCGKVHAPHISTCPDEATFQQLPYIGDGQSYPAITITTFGDVPCAHRSCGDCGGSGVKRLGGGMCVHMIACQCPSCSLVCL